MNEAHFYIIHGIMLLLALAGCMLSVYIYEHKRQKKPLVCPMKGSCATVTESKYSKIAHIPIEVLGIMYYAIVIVIEVHALVFPSVYITTLSTVSLALSTGAFIFSLYLLCIQAFVIKHWCTWCLFSGALCALIFFGTCCLANLI